MPPFFTEEIMEMDWREETLESILAYFNKNPKGAPWADIAVYYPAGEVLSAILKKAAMISENRDCLCFLRRQAMTGPTTFGKFSAAGQLCGLSGLKKNAGRQPSFHPGWEGTVFPSMDGMTAAFLFREPIFSLLQERETRVPRSSQRMILHFQNAAETRNFPKRKKMKG